MQFESIKNLILELNLNIIIRNVNILLQKMKNKIIPKLVVKL